VLCGLHLAGRDAGPPVWDWTCNMNHPGGGGN
jgi:hypothetical protein